MRVHWALDDDDDGGGGESGGDDDGAGQWSGHGGDDTDDVSFPKPFPAVQPFFSLSDSCCRKKIRSGMNSAHFI